jgi:hypothetical protein
MCKNNKTKIKHKHKQKQKQIGTVSDNLIT